jgi:3,4-dihydroxy 2-butanone 4-phosphate synthase / GTP cyclohydrolase II
MSGSPANSASALSELSSPIDLIAAARAGQIVILVRKEGPEAEGCLAVPARFATAESVNFMALHGRGLVCLALTPERADELRLALMPDSRASDRAENFTISIEAREGVGTGISAHDRARTIAVAIDPHSTPDSLTSPGHVFPLVANKRGVLGRAGFSEAAVDIARLAGTIPAGVICRIMSEEGTVARFPELLALAGRRLLKVGRIADVARHRLQTDRTLTLMHREHVRFARSGDWIVALFQDLATDAQYVALAKGDIAQPGTEVVHIASPVGVLCDLLDTTSSPLCSALSRVARQGRGVLVLHNRLMAVGSAGEAKLEHAEIRSVLAGGNEGIIEAIAATLGVGDQRLHVDIE